MTTDFRKCTGPQRALISAMVFDHIAHHPAHEVHADGYLGPKATYIDGRINLYALMDAISAATEQITK